MRFTYFVFIKLAFEPVTLPLIGSLRTGPPIQFRSWAEADVGSLAMLFGFEQQNICFAYNNKGEGLELGRCTMAKTQNFSVFLMQGALRSWP